MAEGACDGPESERLPHEKDPDGLVCNRPGQHAHNVAKRRAHKQSQQAGELALPLPFWRLASVAHHARARILNDEWDSRAVERCYDEDGIE